MMIKKVVWFLFFTALAVSCLEDPDCYNLNNNVIGISFKKIADGKADTIAILGISLNGTDSIFYDTILTTDVNLPLNYLVDQTNIAFTRLGVVSAMVNNLILDYDAKAQFVSEDCGERFVVSDLAVVSSDFDSTRLVNASPTTTPSTNIIIYRCPINDLVRFSFRQWNTNEDDSLGSAMTNLLTGVTDDFSPYIYYVNQSANSIQMPINSAETSTAFNINFADYGSTTVVLNYTSSGKKALYIPCGEQEFFSNLALTDVVSEFDKVKVVKDSIYDPPLTNVAFFKCPVTNRVKIVFRESSGGTNNVEVKILKIKADYTSEEFYVDSSVSSVELPLNEAADVTTFTFTFEDGDKVLQLGYDRTQNTYHEVCNQTEMAGLQIQSASNFPAPPRILDGAIQFPIVNNIAIIVN